SGAMIDPQHRPVMPKLSRTEPAISVRKLSVSAAPVKVLGNELAFGFAGSNVQLNQATAPGGKVVLTFHQADSGEVRVAVARRELEGLIAKIAAIGAARQGVTIDNVQVDLTSRSPR